MLKPQSRHPNQLHRDVAALIKKVAKQHGHNQLDMAVLTKSGSVGSYTRKLASNGDMRLSSVQHIFNCLGYDVHITVTEK